MFLPLLFYSIHVSSIIRMSEFFSHLAVSVIKQVDKETRVRAAGDIRIGV